jgi:hypothetical protein
MPLPCRISGNWVSVAISLRRTPQSGSGRFAAATFQIALEPDAAVEIFVASLFGNATAMRSHGDRGREIAPQLLATLPLSSLRAWVVLPEAPLASAPPSLLPVLLAIGIVSRREHEQPGQRPADSGLQPEAAARPGIEAFVVHSVLPSAVWN